jgi:hypothetical protein
VKFDVSILRARRLTAFRIPHSALLASPHAGMRKCHTELREPEAVRLLRRLYAIPRTVWIAILAIPVTGFLTWLAQEPTTSKTALPNSKTRLPAK